MAAMRSCLLKGAAAAAGAEVEVSSVVVVEAARTPTITLRRESITAPGDTLRSANVDEIEVGDARALNALEAPREA